MFSSQVVLAADSINIQSEEINKGITPSTKEEIEASEKKIKEAQEYVEKKNMIRTANNIKVKFKIHHIYVEHMHLTM